MRRPAKERWGRRALATSAVLAILSALVVYSWAFVWARTVSALTACTSDSDCPTANEDEYTTNADRGLSVRAPGLLANDVGIAGTQVDVLNTDAESWNGARLRVREDGSFAYRPDADDPISGIDYFDYYIEDTQGGWASATVTVQVNAVVRDDGYQARVNTRLAIAAPGVFGNDVAFDATSLFYDTPTRNNGELTLREDGSLVYIPPRDFTGTDSFTYTVYDTLGDNSFTGTVKIAVGERSTPGTTSPDERDPNDDEPNPPNPPGTEPPRASAGPGATLRTSPSTAAPPTSTSGASSASTTSSTARAQGGSPGSTRPGTQGAAAASRGDDSGPPVLPIALAIVAVVGAGTGGYLWWRRHSLTAAEPPPAPPIA
jgi:hypothetical protein